MRLFYYPAKRDCVLEVAFRTGKERVVTATRFFLRKYRRLFRLADVKCLYFGVTEFAAWNW